MRVTILDCLVHTARVWYPFVIHSQWYITSRCTRETYVQHRFHLFSIRSIFLFMGVFMSDQRRGSCCIHADCRIANAMNVITYICRMQVVSSQCFTPSSSLLPHNTSNNRFVSQPHASPTIHALQVPPSQTRESSTNAPHMFPRHRVHGGCLHLRAPRDKEKQARFTTHCSYM